MYSNSDTPDKGSRNAMQKQHKVFSTIQSKFLGIGFQSESV